MSSSLDQFCTWLEATPVSHALQATEWVIPAVQTLHILSIGLVMSSVVLFDLRLLGISFADQPVMRVAARFLPVIWRTLPVLALSGLILIMAEPARSLENGAFQFKMLLLVLSIALMLAAQSRINTNRWNTLGAGVRNAVPILSLLLWTGIVFAGRWIAYVRVQ